jgi:dienelactone hydrolase
MPIGVATSFGMRNRVLTTVAAPALGPGPGPGPRLGLCLCLCVALALGQLACGADPSTPAGEDPAVAGQPPSQDLASGTGSTGTVPAKPGTGTPGTGEGTSVPTPGSAPPIGAPAPPGAPTPAPVDPNAGAGPKPTTTCSVTKDSAGFFARTSSASSYVAYVPASYDGTKPVRLIVGLHGCGDTAMNFATWGVSPYDTRTTQDHIGISIGGADGRCWTASDDAKVLAAVDDISSCFWVHQKKVVIAGFSSGGELAYRLGLSQASRFAGILIEDSGLYAANGNPDGLLANAAWKLDIAHLTHTSDPVFPLATVKADWVKTKAAGFPLVTKETPGAHDGSSTDWAAWLIPQSASWVAP